MTLIMEVDSMFPKGHLRIYHCLKAKLATNINKYLCTIRLRILGKHFFLVFLIGQKQANSCLVCVEHAWKNQTLKHACRTVNNGL